MAFAAFDSSVYGCWDNCLFSQVSLLSHFSRNKYYLQHETDLFKEKKRCIKTGSTIWTITAALIQELVGGGQGVGWRVHLKLHTEDRQHLFKERKDEKH